MCDKNSWFHYACVPTLLMALYVLLMLLIPRGTDMTDPYNLLPFFEKLGIMLSVLIVPFVPIFVVVGYIFGKKAVVAGVNRTGLVLAGLLYAFFPLAIAWFQEISVSNLYLLTGDNNIFITPVIFVLGIASFVLPSFLNKSANSKKKKK
ncbi:MAG: hypothetical protein V1722_00970 [Candidatus Micrarchaeota archaeon]